MGQQAGAFVTWLARSKPISRAFNLWDSIGTKLSHARAKTRTRQKSKSRFTRPAYETLETQHAIAKIFMLWDGCVPKI
jgi:hypothetical protein